MLAMESTVPLSFADAVTVLMEACGLDAKGRNAYEARVRQLQRLSVAARPSGQPRGRLDYGISELAALAVATRLMMAFMVPTLAARYITERWPMFPPFLLSGAVEALPAEYRARRPLNGASIAVIAGNALSEMGDTGRHDERYLGPLGAIAFVRPDAVDLAADAYAVGLFLDSRSFMPSIVRQVASMTMATNEELGAELDRLRFAI